MILPDLLPHIMEHLAPVDLMAAKRVDRAFRTAANEQLKMLGAQDIDSWVANAPRPRRVAAGFWRDAIKHTGGFGARGELSAEQARLAVDRLVRVSTGWPACGVALIYTRAEAGRLASKLGVDVGRAIALVEARR